MGSCDHWSRRGPSFRCILGFGCRSGRYCSLLLMKWKSLQRTVKLSTNCGTNRSSQVPGKVGNPSGSHQSQPARAVMLTWLTWCWVWKGKSQVARGVWVWMPPNFGVSTRTSWTSYWRDSPAVCHAGTAGAEPRRGRRKRRVDPKHRSRRRFFKRNKSCAECLKLSVVNSGLYVTHRGPKSVLPSGKMAGQPQ